MVSSGLPRAAAWVFSWLQRGGRYEALAAGPLELAERCTSQPPLHRLTAVYIIRPTARRTTHSRRSTPRHFSDPSRSSPRPSPPQSADELKHLLFQPRLKQRLSFWFLPRFHRPTQRGARSKADKCNEIQNLRAILRGWGVGGAEVQQFVTISDRMSWPLQLKQ